MWGCHGVVMGEMGVVMGSLWGTEGQEMGRGVVEGDVGS